MVDEYEEYEQERTDNNDLVQKLIEICSEYLQKIEIQTATLQPELEPDDIILKYITNELRVDNEEELHNLSIMIDDRLTETDKNLLSSFTDGLKYIFYKTFGMNIYDNDIRLSWYTYTVFVTHFVDYFVDYIDGLQKVDVDYQDDIPNFQEVSFKYFREKYKNNSEITMSMVSEYLDYVAEYCIFPEMYYDLALLGSPGNIILSCLYTESTNGRITYDSDFFKLKIGKILSSDIKESIVPRLYDILTV